MSQVEYQTLLCVCVCVCVVCVLCVCERESGKKPAIVGVHRLNTTSIA